MTGTESLFVIVKKRTEQGENVSYNVQSGVTSMASLSIPSCRVLEGQASKPGRYIPVNLNGYSSGYPARQTPPYYRVHARAS